MTYLSNKRVNRSRRFAKDNRAELSHHYYQQSIYCILTRIDTPPQDPQIVERPLVFLDEYTVATGQTGEGPSLSTIGSEAGQS